MKRLILISFLAAAACDRTKIDEQPPSRALALSAVNVAEIDEAEAEQQAAEAREARDKAKAERIEAQVRTTMEDELFDPFSARYRALREGRNGALCGQYNAKNRYGAYTGFRDFVASRHSGAVLTSTQNDGIASDFYSAFAFAYLESCATKSEARIYAAATAPEEEMMSADVAMDVPTVETASPTADAYSDFAAAEAGIDDADATDGNAGVAANVAAAETRED